MENIKSVYETYDDLIEEFTKKKIEDRYSHIYQQINNFLKKLNLTNDASVNERTLMHCVLDYFTDVSRLKSFHKIKNINRIKIVSYESYWILKRKPIQILKNESKDSTEMLTFINERFVLSNIASFLLEENVSKPIVKDNASVYEAFLNSLYYNLKYREMCPNSFELIILGFKTGQRLG